MLADHHHAIHGQFAASQRQGLGDGGAKPQRRELPAAVTAQIALADLIDVERNDVHRRMMVRAMPAVPVEVAVDDVFAVGKFEVGSNNGCKLGTNAAHKRMPVFVIGPYAVRPNDKLRQIPLRRNEDLPGCEGATTVHQSFPVAEPDPDARSG